MTKVNFPFSFDNFSQANQSTSQTKLHLKISCVCIFDVTNVTAGQHIAFPNLNTSLFPNLVFDNKLILIGLSKILFIFKYFYYKYLK